MARYMIETEDRRKDGGPFVVIIRRWGAWSAIGIGAGHTLQVALRFAIREVRVRRHAGQFR